MTVVNCIIMNAIAVAVSLIMLHMQTVYKLSVSLIMLHMQTAVCFIQERRHLWAGWAIAPPPPSAF